MPHRFPHDPGRALPAAGGQPLQSLYLRRHPDHRRPPALAGGQPVGGQPQLGQQGGRARPRRSAHLPGRRLARGVQRQDVHGQHPRSSPQHGHPENQRLRLYRLARARFPDGQRRLVAPHQHAHRPGRQRLRHRLVRQAGLPRRVQRGRLGPHQRPDLQGLLSRHEGGDRTGPGKEDRQGADRAVGGQERVVFSPRAAVVAGTGGEQEAGTRHASGPGEDRLPGRGRGPATPRPVGPARDRRHRRGRRLPASLPGRFGLCAGLESAAAHGGGESGRGEPAFRGRRPLAGGAPVRRLRSAASAPGEALGGRRGPGCPRGGRDRPQSPPHGLVRRRAARRRGSGTGP